MSFNKRKYDSLKELLYDLFIVFKDFRLIKLSKGFKHRLMLTLTGVNGCRYCTYLHSKMALINGFSRSEVNQLLNGLPKCPKSEVKALLYAQHYAESRGNPDKRVIKELINNYGLTTVKDINYFLHLVKIGNYFGNTFDYLIYLFKKSLKHLS